jgi:diadenosine tetraphosphatase ApaH/serine/threonine PP2A family protein phosphatase
MLIGLFTDIHGNREAFEACLDHARQSGIGRYVFLGDYVGYGADPGFVLDTVISLVEHGAVALLGNHDAAAIGSAERMNYEAAIAIQWTHGQLDVEHRGFLASLPLTIEDGERLYVHASAANPDQWPYVFDVSGASRSLAATPARLTFCGHVHVPALFHVSTTGKIASFVPSGVGIPLTPRRRWLAVIGSVGQPRDHNPAACYGIYDDASATLTYVRVPYDIESAARKIRDAGLPPFLGERLALGR